MKVKPIFYNIHSFNFFRRQAKQPDLENAFVKLIESKEKKNSNKTISINKNYSNHNENDSLTERKPKKIFLDLMFPSNSMERIEKIRDLFIEFDPDKSRKFDKEELYLMFNMNKIPLTSEEIQNLFKFNRLKKYINFHEFVKLTVNEHFSNKFKKLIMKKVRHRTKEGDICPNDFTDMLSHLCEFGKLSDLKNKKKGEKKKHTFENEKNNFKTIETLENTISVPLNPISSEINQNLKNNEEEENNKDDNKDINNEKQTDENKQGPNLLSKEIEFKNFVEISNKKISRLNNYLKKANVRDNIIKRKENLSKSLKIINNINSNIAHNYISYYPTENVFKNGNNNTIVTFSLKNNNNQNLSQIKYNNTEKNIFLNDRKNLKYSYYFNNLIKNHRINKLTKKRRNEYNDSLRKNNSLSKKKIMKEKNIMSLYNDFKLNFQNLPLIQNKAKYSEKTFVNTGLYSKYG
jgi:hypothetical protein